jgi:hypothetical protein
MITVAEAFTKFRSRLEATDAEEKSAASRQKRIREQLDASSIAIERDFLAGSYRRETKTKPLRDVDIFVVLSDRSYLDKHPSVVLNDVLAVLEPSYPGRACTDRRAVRVDFGVTYVAEVTDEVMSFDVVPAFADDTAYLIPDDVTGTWIKTNPEVHAAKATQANKDYDTCWKPLVKMIKKWNAHNGDPIEPSFLIEVMALDILKGTWGGSYPRELRMFFADASARIGEGWKDPAGVGPNVSDELDADAGKLLTAETALSNAEKACTRAFALDQGGKTGEALAAWQDLLGPLFSKS